MKEQRIRTRCPNCGHDGLIIGSNGMLVCSWLECNDPTAINRAGDQLVNAESGEVEMYEGDSNKVDVGYDARERASAHAEMQKAVQARRTGGGGCGPNTSAPPHEGILSQVDSNTVMLNEAHQVLSTLENALEPVLSPRPPEPVAGEAEKPYGLSAVVDHQRYLINGLASRIQNLRQRLML